MINFDMIASKTKNPKVGETWMYLYICDHEVILYEGWGNTYQEAVKMFDKNSNGKIGCNDNCETGKPVMIGPMPTGLHWSRPVSNVL